MGMTIEEAIEIISDIDKAYRTFSNMEYKAMQKSIDVMRKYQQLQATYENRLKADMVAILTEIQLEIEELDSRAGYSGNGMPTFSTDYIRKKKVNELIQQKINALQKT